MGNIELDLKNYKYKSISIHSKDTYLINEVSSNFDLLVCYLLDDRLYLQDIIDKVSNFKGKHIQIKIIKNSRYFNQIEKLNLYNIILKNIDLTNRYLVLNLFVMSTDKKHLENNNKILASKDLLMSRKSKEIEGL